MAGCVIEEGRKTMNGCCIQDESKYEGFADTICKPETIKELSEFVKNCRNKGESITVHGSLTGIAGGGVPLHGHAVCMQKLNGVRVEWSGKKGYAVVQGGVTGQQLEEEVRRQTDNTLFFPLLPTENTATIGGAAACRARGIYLSGYGELKDYVEEITVCGEGGNLTTLLKDAPEFEDWFGSEGMFGIITELRIKLLPRPAHTWGIGFQFESDETACNFADAAASKEWLVAMEYMDRNTIEVIERYKGQLEAISGLPDMGCETAAFLYTEIIGDTQEIIEERAEKLLSFCVESGGDPENTWAMCTEEELNQIRAYRHAASECVNMVVGCSHGSDARIHKLSLDVSRALTDRKTLLKSYRDSLSSTGISYCIFGHFKTGGPYVNIMAEDYNQYKTGLCFMDEWTKAAFMDKAEVFREHGVGKLKKKLFFERAPIEIVNQILKKKTKWDKENLFNPGNMI